MKVFISWSGDLSKNVAFKLHNWLPNVIQGLEPYLSSEDIEKGAKWFSDISSELDETNFGIICLTQDNMNAPWILFEAGALSKKVDKSRVTPLLVDVSSTDVTGPLTQFQHTTVNQEDMKRLLRDINTNSGAMKLEESRLNAAFNKWWPEFANEFDLIRAAQPPSEDTKGHRADRELLEEVVKATRSIQSLLIEDTRKQEAQNAARAFLLNSQRELNRGLGTTQPDLLSDALELSEATANMHLGGTKSEFKSLTTPQQAILMDLCHQPVQSIEELAENTKLPKQLIKQAIEGLSSRWIKWDGNGRFTAKIFPVEFRRELAIKGGERRNHPEREDD